MTLDVTTLTPDDLVDMPDEDFRAVVDADLRRNSRNRPHLPPEVAAALREPRHVPRWHMTLSRMDKSVEGQLAARADDYEKELAWSRRRTLELEAELDAALEEGQTFKADETRKRLREVRLQQEQLTEQHHRGRASTLRFKTGLDEALLEAQYLRDRLQGDARVRELEEAIRAHRQELTASEELEAGSADEKLWSVLNN